MKALHVISIALLLMLVACGGSNSGSTPIPPVPTPETAHGVYVGTVASGNTFDNEVHFEAVILPNDEFYAVYWYQYYSESMTGQGTSKPSAGTYTVSGLKDYSDNQYPESLVTQYSNGTITGSLKEDTQVEGTPLTFTGRNPASYDFDTPASLRMTAGTWASLDGSGDQLEIGADGTFTGSISGDCYYTGTLTPDSSHNFYRISIAYSPACYSNQTVTGVAVCIPSPESAYYNEIILFLETSNGERGVFRGRNIS